MENTLEKMSIDTENNQAGIIYTSELQQPMEHTMTIVSPTDAAMTTTTTTTTTTTNANADTTTGTYYSVDYSKQQLQQLQQLQSCSSTIEPFISSDNEITSYQPLDLNQIFTQHSAITTASSSTSPTMNHNPSTFLLKSTLRNDMLAQSLPSPIDPLSLVADTDDSTNATTFANSNMIVSSITTQQLSNVTQYGLSTTTINASTVIKPPTLVTSAKRTIRKKPSSPGQATMPIRVCTKSTRPPRHIICYNCKTTKSPLWRRTPDRKETLCNACGLFYRQYNTHRIIRSRHKSPLLGRTLNGNNNNNNNNFAIKVSELSDASTTTIETTNTTNRHKKDNHDGIVAMVAAGTPSSHDNQHHQAMQCVNCHQTMTPLWRKNKRGELLCNACGLYSRLHQRDRPVKLCKTTVQRRRRDYWNIEEKEQLGTCLGKSGMVSTFSLAHQAPLLSPTSASVASSPDSTTMDGEMAAITGSNLPGSDKPRLDFGEEDNTRFASLLVQMDRRQMQGFLGMLEQRCHVVRTLLDLSGNGSG